MFTQLSSGVAAAGPGEEPREIAANAARSSDPDGATLIGRCGAYVAIDGSAKLERVEETAASATQATSGGGPRYAGYEVWFSFTPDQPVSDAETAAWIAKEHELRRIPGIPGPLS